MKRVRTPIFPCLHLGSIPVLLALECKHSIVESANTNNGLPHLVICYSLNVERIIVTVKKKSVAPIICLHVRGEFYSSG